MRSAAAWVGDIRWLKDLMAVIKARADWFERNRVAYVTRTATAIGALGARLAGRLLGSVPAGARRGGLDLPLGA
jgi:hypothetical protein